MRSLNRLAARVAGKIPLRTVVIVPFVLQIVGTVRFVGYLSFKTGQNAVTEVAHQLMAQVEEGISDRITNDLSAPHNISAKLIQGNADRICFTPTASPKKLFIRWLTISVKTTDTIIGYSGCQRNILIVDDRWENRAVLINANAFVVDRQKNGIWL